MARWLKISKSFRDNNSPSQNILPDIPGNNQNLPNNIDNIDNTTSNGADNGTENDPREDQTEEEVTIDTDEDLEDECPVLNHLY